MTRILALLFAVALTLNCATAGPIAIKCGLQDVSIAAADYAEIKADIQTKNWTDLAKVGETIGWATLDCALGDEASKNPAAKSNIDEFRQLHSVEFRAAGGSACNSLRGGPAAGQEPHKLYQLGSTPSPATFGTGALASCDRVCGRALTGLVTPSGCSCWRASKTDWRQSRWVPLRGARGLGMVAAR